MNGQAAVPRVPGVEIIPNTPEGIERAAGCIRGGGLVAWPTPLWYALSANALSRAAVSRLYAAKKRPLTQPLILTTTDLADARRYGHINPVAEKLVASYWPGYLGIVVRKRPAAVPDLVTSGRDTVLLVCLRGLGHDLPCRAGVPVVASSANVSGTAPALSVAKVHEFAKQAGDMVDAVIDGPLCPFNRPTTIVDTTASPPLLLRSGLVHERSIRMILPDLAARPADAE